LIILIKMTAEPPTSTDLGREPMQEHYLRPDGLPPVNGYSHAVAFSGRMVAASGQVPLDGEGRLVGQDDPEARSRRVFENLAAALVAAGARMAGRQDDDLLTDLADLEAVRLVPDEFISLDKPPPAHWCKSAAWSTQNSGSRSTPWLRSELEHTRIPEDPHRQPTSKILIHRY
jgi:enamine deaminase RidA (YjgF/YER057c/UK114 family)